MRQLPRVPACRRRLKGIHSRSDTSRTGAESLSFYYRRLLHCLNQMLAVMSLSQHRVSSSKTVRPRAPCGARCIGHAILCYIRCDRIVGTPLKIAHIVSFRCRCFLRDHYEVGTKSGKYKIDLR